MGGGDTLALNSVSQLLYVVIGYICEGKRNLSVLIELVVGLISLDKINRMISSMSAAFFARSTLRTSAFKLSILFLFA